MSSFVKPFAGRLLHVAVPRPLLTLRKGLQVFQTCTVNCGDGSYCSFSSVVACAGWSIFSSLPQPLMAVPAFLFVEAFAPALPYGIGFAAGAMFYMVFVELLPEAYEQAPRSRVSLVISIALIAMLLFQRFI